MSIFPELFVSIRRFLDSFYLIDNQRRASLDDIVDKLLIKSLNLTYDLHVNFLCNHNAKRSIYAHVWAYTAKVFFGIDKVSIWSSGIDPSKVKHSTAISIADKGFDVDVLDEDTGVYSVVLGEHLPNLTIFSKKCDLNEWQEEDSCTCVIVNCLDSWEYFQQNPIPCDQMLYAKQQGVDMLDLIGIEVFYIFSELNRKKQGMQSRKLALV
ncbi:hypothetical protein [Aureibacter tunicatorum]|uniref:Uncharacterized protein n=1 Tax=Aureibacter tunicatorum TaxID=866807 RepID=A0AAE3XLN0_9BACT|nr:hypothetical protein [Aureibacter tunicatorum]MDR6238215.1 hypothetical protein [Aureibacter tunicatorum]BDD03248.1 hypothetical protein AUTU_07310 [Aureibacter tunicatorum]